MAIALHIVLLAVAGGALGYLCLLSVIALASRKKPLPVSQKRNVFAVVVPAHNEELNIQETVRSLRAMDYPSDGFDVIVVADNCTDRTEERARAAGAVVLNRTSALQRGKGYALRWCFDRILVPETRYSAVVICDADTTVSPGLLAVMDTYLEAGDVAIQCNDQVRPAPGSWSSEATRLGLLLYNYVRPMARKSLCCSAGLRGNGMCFTSSLLLAIPWDAYSRNEDLEYALKLLLIGVPVTFAPEATVLATMPLDARHAQSQRARWEGGRFPIIRKYAAELLFRAIAERSYVLFDAFVDLLTPALVNVMAGAFAMTMLSVALWMVGFQDMNIAAVAWAVVLALGIGHIALGLKAAGSAVRATDIFHHVPRYALWKLRLYLTLLWRGNTSAWIRTPRESVGGIQKRRGT